MRCFYQTELTGKGNGGIRLSLYWSSVDFQVDLQGIV